MKVCQRMEKGPGSPARRNSRAGFAAKRLILRKSFKMHDFSASLQTVKFPSATVFAASIHAPLDWISR